MIDIEKAIEMMKTELFIEMIGADETAAKFTRLLVKNGCPFDAILKTFRDLGKTEDDDEDQDDPNG